MSISNENRNFKFQIVNTMFMGIEHWMEKVEQYMYTGVTMGMEVYTLTNFK